MSWTQPICEGCWELTHPGRIPVTLKMKQEPVRCCECGEMTGEYPIWVRRDPKIVPYPHEENDDMG